jgi:hypothetical protein
MATQTINSKVGKQKEQQARKKLKQSRYDLVNVMWYKANKMEGYLEALTSAPYSINKFTTRSVLV